MTATMRYDFWATVGRVVAAIASFIGKPLSEEEGEKCARDFANKTAETFLYVCGVVLGWLDVAQWTIRATFGTALLAIAETILPRDLKANTNDDKTTDQPTIPVATLLVATPTLQNAPETPATVEPTLTPAEPVEVAQNASQEQETASEGEVAYTRKQRTSGGKVRTDYRKVLDPVPGALYWYKRGRGYVELRHPQRQAA